MLFSALTLVLQHPECDLRLQIVGITVPMTVSIVAAFLGCTTFERLMPLLGTPVDISGAYATTAFVTLSNPFLVIFALLFAPVTLPPPPSPLAMPFDKLPASDSTILYFHGNGLLMGVRDLDAIYLRKNC